MYGWYEQFLDLSCAGLPTTPSFTSATLSFPSATWLLPGVWPWAFTGGPYVLPFGGSSSISFPPILFPLFVHFFFFFPLLQWMMVACMTRLERTFLVVDQRFLLFQLSDSFFINL
ncbi:hypothetical protein Scep_021326 [Stephania cephalantha]|uniref:Uncharacterized protein n=1 Tax=Stephania cephalantha TaxID=152367 RepID=A0AAP0F5X9_9MAGN